MELSFDRGQPAVPKAAPREPSSDEGVPPVVDRSDSFVEPVARRYSFLVECECPGDCLRDHANE
jgi:hypothetical protein